MVTTASSVLRGTCPLLSTRVMWDCRVPSALHSRYVGVRAQRVADDQDRRDVHDARFPSIDDDPKLVDAHGVVADSDAPGRDCLKGSDARKLHHQGRRHSAALVEHHSGRHAVFRRTAPKPPRSPAGSSCAVTSVPFVAVTPMTVG
jgi:hypothetical protein